eukprot:1922280-Rhodomonas_salina.1
MDLAGGEEAVAERDPALLDRQLGPNGEEAVAERDPALLDRQLKQRAENAPCSVMRVSVRGISWGRVRGEGGMGERGGCRRRRRKRRRKRRKGCRG